MHCSYGVADTVCVAHVGAKTAGPAHLNSAASAKEAIRAMEAEKQERADREAGIVCIAHMVWLTLFVLPM